LSLPCSGPCSFQSSNGHLESLNSGQFRPPRSAAACAFFPPSQSHGLSDTT
jgi:hypothetical protein